MLLLTKRGRVVYRTGESSNEEAYEEQAQPQRPPGACHAVSGTTRSSCLAIGGDNSVLYQGYRSRGAPGSLLHQAWLV